VIQGDGINIHVIAAICKAVIADGFSVENVAFGMGGGLLQKVFSFTLTPDTCWEAHCVPPHLPGDGQHPWPASLVTSWTQQCGLQVNRDTMGFATKLCHIHYVDGGARDVMKCPKTDQSKFSLPGALAVKNVYGIPTVFPAGSVSADEDLLEVVYNCGPVDMKWPTFDEMRAQVNSQWASLPPAHNPISLELQEKVKKVSAQMNATMNGQV
jgi:nicotinamide phosphoribosyltransferase